LAATVNSRDVISCSPVNGQQDTTEVKVQKKDKVSDDIIRIFHTPRKHVQGNHAHFALPFVFLSLTWKLKVMSRRMTRDIKGSVLFMSHGRWQREI
jgi:hypothetical protein